MADLTIKRRNGRRIHDHPSRAIRPDRVGSHHARRELAGAVEAAHQIDPNGAFEKTRIMGHTARHRLCRATDPGTIDQDPRRPMRSAGDVDPARHRRGVADIDRGKGTADGLGVFGRKVRLAAK